MTRTDTPDLATPLTAEELRDAVIEAQYRFGRVSKVPIAVWNIFLGAARRQPVAARQPVAETALREAARGMIEHWDEFVEHHHWDEDGCRDRLRAALATREPAPAPLDRLVTALGTHFLKDGSPCFCPRWDAIYGNGDIIHQPRCRLGRMALGYPGDARTVGCAASDDECKGRARLAHSKDEP